MLRRLLFASLAIAPIAIALHYVADLDETTEFVVSAIALIPLAWLIGEATEHAAEHTGPGIGGFLNATFGNAPELIIALIAVNEGLTEVVRGSLTGSVVGNLLLVLGVSLVAGGDGALDRLSTFVALTSVAAATLLFLIPSVPGWDGDPERHDLAVLSVPVSIALLVGYVVVTMFTLRRHRTMHVASDEEVEAWSFRLSLAVLGVATVATAFVAEILVGSLEVFAEQVGLSDFFVAADVGEPDRALPEDLPAPECGSRDGGHALRGLRGREQAVELVRRRRGHRGLEGRARRRARRPRPSGRGASQREAPSDGSSRRGRRLLRGAG